jgi:hypothetical protein
MKMKIAYFAWLSKTAGIIHALDIGALRRPGHLPSRSRFGKARATRPFMFELSNALHWNFAGVHETSENY